jgi:hypothetical protein
MDQMKGLRHLTCFFMGVNGQGREDNLQAGVLWCGAFSPAPFSRPIFAIRTFDIKSQEG